MKVRVFLIIAFSFFSVLFLQSNTQAASLDDTLAKLTMDETTLDMFAQNNILFYEPCVATSSGSMNGSFKVDPTVNPWYPEGDILRTFAGGNGTAYIGKNKNSEAFNSTQDDNDMDGMQYIYAEQYDITWNGNVPTFTKNNSNSTVKYYWVVLPDQAYNHAVGETYLATFEKLNEPIHFIVFDTHACEHQHDPNYCDAAQQDPQGVTAGKNFLGAFTNKNGNSTTLYDKTGGLTGLHRLTGEESNKPIAEESGSAIASANSGIVSWQDGWIVNGMSGFTKEDAASVSKDSNFQKDYTTNGKPNKILLHYTQGTTDGLAAYGSNVYPAHFTIDLKKKTVSQHFPVNKPAVATKGGDLGGAIQIEIVGYGFGPDGNCVIEGQDYTNNDYCFSKFADEDWDYLATLMVAIQQWGKDNGAEIPLTTSVDWDLKKGADNIRIKTTSDYDKTTGVVAHMHSPGDDHTDTGNIWQLVEAALQRATQKDPCKNSGSGNGDLSTLVQKYAWPDYKGDYDIDMPDYKTAAEKHISEGKYTGSAGFTSHDPGVDCGGFVTIIVQDSKLDENYNSGNGNTVSQWQYLRQNWEPINSSENDPVDSSQLKAGDVAINSDHTFIYVGDVSGFNSKIASASWGTRAPMAGTESLNGYQWFRKKGQ